MKNELISVVQSIPYGFVMSYGAVALEIEKRYGIHTSGWIVGRLLGNLKRDSLVPRWRVVNRHGVVSTLKLGEKGLLQIKYLEGEGVEVLEGKVIMEKYEYIFL